MKYHQLQDGEWTTPVMRGYREMCCQCSLVHRIDFRIRDGQLQFRATRDKRATAAARRRKGKHEQFWAKIIKDLK